MHLSGTVAWQGRAIRWADASQDTQILIYKLGDEKLMERAYPISGKCVDWEMPPRNVTNLIRWLRRLFPEYEHPQNQQSLFDVSSASSFDPETRNIRYCVSK